MNRHLHTEPHIHIALVFHICIRASARIYKEGPYRVPGFCWACKVDEVSAKEKKKVITLSLIVCYL